MVSIEEYRKIMNDQTSSEEQIKKRLGYLEAFCRNVIKGEIEKFLKTQ
jgi:hypothetical protein